MKGKIYKRKKSKISMEVEILKSSKEEVTLKVDNVTVAEILRFYLNESGIEFVAWKREHPSKPLDMKIKASKGTVKKAVADAITSIKKDADNFVNVLKK